MGLGPLPLAPHHFDPNLRVGGNDAHGPGDFWPANFDRRIGAVHHQAFVGERELHLAGQAGHHISVDRVYPPPQRRKRDAPIHRAGV